jgi:pSer/pThr/pTyr-binding forkhead associated (FHA) protein
MSDPFATSAPAPRATELLVLHADGRTERFELEPGRPFVVGRALDADYLLDREGVDRQHLHLAHRDGGWWLLGGASTTSGTWLEGRFVLEARRLVDGDVLQIGGVPDVLFQVSDPGSRLPPAPPRFDA